MVQLSTGYSNTYNYCPNHLKTRPLEILTYLPGFKMLFFYKMATIVWISKGWASGLQIPFKIWTNLF